MAAHRPTFDPNRIATPAPAPVASAPQTMTVWQLNAMIGRVLVDHLPGTIHVVGEISNCCRHTSGHMYLTLKDERSEIRAVMWKSAVRGLKFEPADGLEVIATGHVDIYAERGQYQFYISRLEPRGVGALELAFRQMREKLEKAGLFDPRRKRPIPRFPRRIAVVTSSTGAAIRDILQALRRRFPSVSVLLHPVRVQGEGAAEEIAAAIRRVNDQAARLGGVDVMIVGRGGGSLEDLWAFNEEVVARAIFDSRIPVISGVGHEVDVSIADLVADLRAATPTAAAELAVPLLEEVLATLTGFVGRLDRGSRHGLELARSRLDSVARCDLLRDPAALLHRREQRLDELHGQLRWAAGQRIERARQLLHELEVAWAGARPTVIARQQQRLAACAHRLQWALLQRVRQVEGRLAAADHRLRSVGPQRRHEAAAQRADLAAGSLSRAAGRQLERLRQHLEHLYARLESTSYRRTLARGFTITRTRRGQIVTNAAQVRPGDKVVTETAEGTFESRVSDAKQGELFD
jgi:exodeoxyribonuclease VII large subunit